MGEVFPCVLSYCLEHEVGVELTCPAVDGLTFALDRFRADEERFGVGLTAVLTTAEVGTLFIGSHARMGAAHLGYATQADTEAARPRLPLSRSVAGGAAATGAAWFHLFYPDCPVTLSQYETLPWPRARGLALGFAERGEWPADVEWFNG
jgi:hypothetical protein